MLTREDVVVAGVRSPVLMGGASDSEEAVVFVHGNPGSSLDWTDLGERASLFARTVAPDMPGYGTADKPPGFSYTVEGYADHLQGILDQLGIRRAHLVLHDFGGPWGLAWAAAHPTAVASLSFINIGVLPDYRWHILAQIWRTPFIGEAFMATTTRPAFGLLLKRGCPRGLPKAFIDQMFDHFDPDTRRAVIKLYRATSDPGPRSERYAKVLQPYDLPCLVLWGRADPYLPVSYAERQRDYFPKAKVEIIEDSGHWPHADNPERVAAALIPFLKSRLERTR